MLAVLALMLQYIKVQTIQNGRIVNKYLHVNVGDVTEIKAHSHWWHYPPATLFNPIYTILKFTKCSFTLFFHNGLMKVLWNNYQVETTTRHVAHKFFVVSFFFFFKTTKQYCTETHTSN